MNRGDIDQGPPSDYTIMIALPSSPSRKAISLLIGLLTVLVGLYALRETWGAPLLRAMLDRLAVSNLGQHISVGRISGNYYTYLVFEDIRSTPSPTTGTAVGVQVRRLEARFRLAALLRGGEAFLENLALLAEAPEIVMAPADQEAPGDSGLAKPLVLPAWLPALQVHKGSMVWRHGDITVDSREVDLQVTRPVIRDQPYRLALTMGELRLATPLLAWAGPVTAQAEASATAITVQSLRLGDDLVARSAHWQWPGKTGEGPAFAVDLALFEGQLQASLAGQGDLWEGSLEMAGINLAKVPGTLPPILHEGILEGAGHCRGDLTRSPTWEGTTSLSLIKGPEKLQLTASLADDALRVERLSAELGVNQLVVEQASLTIPAIRNHKVRELLQEAAGRFSLQLTDIPGLLDRIMPTPLPAPPAGGYPVHRLAATGRFQGGQALVAQLNLTTAHNALIFKDIGLRLPEKPAASLLLSTLQAKGRVQIDDLNELATLFGQQPMTGHLQGTLDVSGPLNSPVGDLAVDGRDFNLRGVTIDTVTVQAHADLNGVRIMDCRLLRGNDRLTLQGAFDYKKQEIRDLDLDIRLTDLAAYSALAPWLRDTNGALRATVQGAGPLTTPRLKLDLAGQELSVRGHALGAIHLEAMTMARDVVAYAAAVERPPMALRTTGEVTLDREKSRATLALQTFALEGRQPWLGLDHPAACTISWAEGARIAVENLLLTGPAGSLLVDGAVGMQADNALRVNIKDLRGDEWLALADERLRLEGGNLRVEMRGPWQAPVIRVEGSVAKFGGPQRDPTLAGEFEVSIGLDRIFVNRCLWGDGHGSSLSFSGTLPANLLLTGALPQNRWDLQAELKLADLRVLSPFLPAGLPLQGEMQGEVHLEGPWQAPSGRLQVTGSGLRPHDFMAQAPPGLFTAELEVTLAGDRLRLTSIGLEGENLTLGCQGEVLGLPHWPDIAAGTADWTGGRLDLRGGFVAPDLGWLAKEAGLRAVRGRLHGDVSMAGPLSHPTLGGQVQLTGGELRFDTAMTPFKNVTASAELDGRVIRLQKISGALGGAPFQGSGLVDFEPRDGGPHLVLDLQGQDLLFYRQEGLKVRADADLHAQGPLARLEISGNLALADGQWTRNFNFLSLLPGPAAPGVVHDLPLFSLRQYPWNALRFNVRGVTRKPFQVRNNIVSGTLRPDLLLTGTGETPVLTGVVYLDPSRIDMPAGKIFLKSGVLHFAAKAPTRPDLEVVGQARMMGYDINLTVSGTVAEPVVTLSSTPPLPEDQLLLLLLAGQAPQAGTAGTGGRRQGVMTAAVYLGQGFLSDIFAGDSTDATESVLERFELEVGRGVSRKGDETLDAQYRLLNLGEKAKDSMYLTGGRDMYDYFNLGLKIVFRFQ